ncbi:MAG: hypothetical protein WEB58_04580 [Planctomycetaceae bacterium]
MDDANGSLSDSKHHEPGNSGRAPSIEWYAPGQTRVFEFDGIEIAVRFVERRGRRGRISITGVLR